MIFKEVDFPKNLKCVWVKEHIGNEPIEKLYYSTVIVKMTLTTILSVS